GRHRRPGHRAPPAPVVPPLPDPVPWPVVPALPAPVAPVLPEPVTLLLPEPVLPLLPPPIEPSLGADACGAGVRGSPGRGLSLCCARSVRGPVAPLDWASARPEAVATASASARC